MKCSQTHRLDFDNLYCALDDGHAGYHWDEGEQGGFYWQPADPPLGGMGAVHADRSQS